MKIASSTSPSLSARVIGRKFAAFIILISSPVPPGPASTKSWWKVAVARLRSIGPW